MQMTDVPLVDRIAGNISNVVSVDGKYYAVIHETNYEAFIVSKTTETYEEKTYYIVADDTGKVSETIPLALESVNGLLLTERGLFAIPFENGENRFRWYDFTGTVLADTSLDAIRPDGGTSKPSLSAAHPLFNPLPIASTEDEIAMFWGKKLAFYDDTLTMTATLELPGDSVGIVPADSGYYVTCRTVEGLITMELRDHTIVQEFATPAYMNGSSPVYEGAQIDCYDGNFYFYKDDVLYRYRLAADADSKQIPYEPVADFLQSGITSSVRGVDIFCRDNNDQPNMALS